MTNYSKIVHGLKATSDGVFPVQILKRTISEDEPLSEAYHRFVLSPGDDLAVTQARIDASLQSLGATPVDPDNWAALAEAAETVWTPELIEAWQSRPPPAF